MLDTSPASDAMGARMQREPKYWGLKRHLLELLSSLPPGSPIPTERSLAAEFDVSRTTVRQALAELTVEGRLLRVQGKGTFAAEPKVAQRLQLSSYTEDMRAQGREPSTKLLDMSEVPAEVELARLLGVRAGAKILRLHGCASPTASRWRSRPRTCRSAGSAGCASTSAAAGRSTRCCATGSASRWGTPRRPSRPRWPGPRRPTCCARTSACRCCCCRGTPSTATDKPVEWVRSVYRGDRYKFVATLNRP